MNTNIKGKTKKPSKSRKALIEMGKHIRSKAIKSHLNEKLQKELGKRSLSVRKDDTVKIMRGSFKGKTGKILRVNRLKMKVYVEKVTRKKSDGTEFEVAIDPSKVLLIEIDRSDRKRLKKNKKEKKAKEGVKDE